MSNNLTSTLIASSSRYYYYRRNVVILGIRSRRTLLQSSSAIRPSNTNIASHSTSLWYYSLTAASSLLLSAIALTALSSSPLNITESSSSKLVTTAAHSLSPGADNDDQGNNKLVATSNMTFVKVFEQRLFSPSHHYRIEQPFVLEAPTPLASSLASSRCSNDNLLVVVREADKVVGHHQELQPHMGSRVLPLQLQDKYHVEWDNVLGEGAYGCVHLARCSTPVPSTITSSRNEKQPIATAAMVAVKIIPRDRTDMNAFSSELMTLRRIRDHGGHPNVTGLYDYDQDDSCYYLVLEYVSGCELLQHLNEYGALTDSEAIPLVQGLASALSFLHTLGIIHADLKPENMLITRSNQNNQQQGDDDVDSVHGSIKLIDFGCSVILNEEQDNNESCNNSNHHNPKNNFLNTNCNISTGTRAYWPPERFEKGAIPTTAMDMWSTGIVLYIILTGVHPFDPVGILSDEDLSTTVCRDPRSPFHADSVARHLSPLAIDLLQKLLEPDPRQRLTATEMMQHPWFRKEQDATTLTVAGDFDCK